MTMDWDDDSDFTHGFEPDEMDEDARHMLDDTDDDMSDDQVAYARLLDREGVTRTCSICDSKFRGMPDHGVCDTCADQSEMGSY